MASFLPLISIFFMLASSAVTSDAALHSVKMGLKARTTEGELSISQSALAGNISKGFEIYNYTQTLDHFNYQPNGYDTFQQRYAINYKYWGGAKNNSPIFFYIGDAESVEGELVDSGFVVDIAAHFQALLVYIEHRYYGKSYPFGSKAQAYKNAEALGYFSSTQALADNAQFITDLKKNLSAELCPVIAVGTGYGGMLASWLRLKYPHIVIGALASSAPILDFNNSTPQNGFCRVVTKDFQEASESCVKTIKASWYEIDKISSQPDGLKLLSQIFHTCKPLKDIRTLKRFLQNEYYVAAVFDEPPTYPVNVICNGIVGTAQGATVLERIISGIEANRGKEQCLHVEYFSEDEVNPTPQNLYGWYWQSCTEMVFRIGCEGNDTMFQAMPFDIDSHIKDCKKIYGVTPRPHWITTEFGVLNMKLALKRFGSNIIFSNGLRDPISSGGVLENISDSIFAIYTTEGSNCLDLRSPRPDDPEWLISQRNAEIKIMKSWIATYNADIITKA